MEIQPNECPDCHAILNASTGIENSSEPEEGDITICAYCMTTLFFEEGMKLRELTPIEFSNLPQEVQDKIIQARSMILAFKTSPRR